MEAAVFRVEISHQLPPQELSVLVSCLGRLSLAELLEQPPKRLIRDCKTPAFVKTTLIRRQLFILCQGRVVFLRCLARCGFSFSLFALRVETLSQAAQRLGHNRAVVAEGRALAV